VDAVQESVTLVPVAPVTLRPLGAEGEAAAPVEDSVTTAVAAEVPLVEPLRLEAITLNRSVEPTSAAVTP
jgi:hypothetical protein